MTDSQRCSRCRRLLPLQAFDRDATRPLGVRADCAACRCDCDHGCVCKYGAPIPVWESVRDGRPDPWGHSKAAWPTYDPASPYPYEKPPKTKPGDPPRVLPAHQNVDAAWRRLIAVDPWRWRELMQVTQDGDLIVPCPRGHSRHQWSAMPVRITLDQADTEQHETEIGDMQDDQAEGASWRDDPAMYAKVAHSVLAWVIDEGEHPAGRAARYLATGSGEEAVRRLLAAGLFAEPGILKPAEPADVPKPATTRRRRAR